MLHKGCVDNCRHRVLVSEEGGSDASIFGEHPVVAKCSNTEYDLALAVVPHPHLGFLATPKSNRIGNCPTLALHTEWNDIETKQWLRKVVWETNGNFQQDEWATLHLGDFKLGDIARSFDKADIGKRTPYHVVTHNCASLLIQMGRELGINPAKHEIRSFVKQNLAKDANSREAIVKGTSRTELGRALMEGLDASAIVEKVVDNYIDSN